jgi:V8-like Glu-specific endopeptidase
MTPWEGYWTLRDAVVQIRAPGEGATGFFVSDDLLVTVGHAKYIMECEECLILDVYNRATTMDRIVEEPVWDETLADWALALFPRGTSKAWVEYECTIPAIGTPVLSVGWPAMALDWSMSTGYVSGTRTNTRKGLNLIPTNLFGAAEGTSGSPVLNLETGKVWGIITSGARGQMGLFSVLVTPLRDTPLCPSGL